MRASVDFRPVSRENVPPYFVFDTLAGLGGITHGLFTRHGGASAAPFDSLNVSSSIGDDHATVDVNRARVLAALGRPRASVVMAGLVHGTDVACVGQDARGESLTGGGSYVPRVDALVTDDPDTTLLITAADCAQVFLVDPERRAVGLAHAGWRGSAAGVLTATVAAMRQHFGSDPATLRAAIGPSLGPCCARFSHPHDELPDWCAPFIHGHHVDLWAMNAYQLEQSGVMSGHISIANVCTVCNRDRFFSHRGDAGRTGRFAAVIALGDPPDLSAGR